MTTYTANGMALLDGADSVMNCFIHGSPQKQAGTSPMARPNTPIVKRELHYDYHLSSTPPSPAPSISSSSMVASASSSSLSSIASNSSMASFGSAIPSTFPYNTIRPMSPGQPIYPHMQRRPSMQGFPSPSYEKEEPANSTNKRRRSSSSEGSPKSPQKPYASPAQRAKEGLEVWPEDVEAAFMEALNVIPKLGRRKVMINGKPCGRNELIADFIRRKTLKVRSRKQVSSHIQVLKNLRRNDAEFMNLVTESMDEVESFPAALMQAGFHIADIPCIKTDHFSAMFPAAGGLAASPMEGGPLLSPYTPTFLNRESSFIPSPITATSGGLNPASAGDGHISFPSASPGSSLSMAMKDMSFPFPPQTSQRRKQACPLVPRSFCIWADSNQTDEIHTYTQLEYNKDASPLPSSTVFLEDLDMANMRFAKLASMHEFLPCQFLHVKLDLSLPMAETNPRLDSLHAALSLSSMQDLNLTSVITVYSYGTQVLSIEEPLDGPFRAVPSSKKGGLDGSPSSASPGTSGTPHTPNGTPRYRFTYKSSFASEFWSIFLRGSREPGTDSTPDNLPPLAKTEAERKQMQAAISGMSAIQEFVVRPDDCNSSMSQTIDSGAVSPGSSLGHVVLVVAYDFTVPDTAEAGPAIISYLSIRDNPRTFVTHGQEDPGRAQVLSPGFGRSPSPLSQSPAITLEHVAESMAHTRANRPNLVLNIPDQQSMSQVMLGAIPQAQLLEPPITPALRIMHTPPYENFYQA